MDGRKREHSTTSDGKPPRPGHEHGSAPAPADPETGMHGAYWVLTEEDRARGLVRPVRRSYVHAGVRPARPTRELTAEERERHAGSGYVAYEEYPEDHALAGRFWTRAQLESGCGATTTMGLAIAETYAREPGYYGATMCVVCRGHFPVGKLGEFVWEGTDERVGS